MAELAVFSLAKQVLSASASPALKMAYEKGLSIWEAKGELEKLQVTIETIIAVLLDAEKKQESSAAVKNWIKRLKGVLYEAEDLFDDVATKELLKQQIMNKGTNKISKKVQIGCSMLNPIISRNSIANKVKAIRKKLTDISSDMAGLGFVRCENFEDGVTNRVRRGQDPGSFIDSKSVIGRDGDKKVILEMLLRDDSLQDGPFVIAIVGFGGLGKTTLAQLVYNDAEVKKNFDNMWFACISDESGEKEVLGKIFHSISGESYSEFSVSQLQTRIRELTVGKKFLLVLDDVWDDDCNRWAMRMGLLGGGAKGSKIIVTTRLLSVAKGVKALEKHILDGLSEEDSWDLFKRIAFAPGYENDPRRVDLGKEIVRKCRNVPLAIRNIASLLSEKDTIQEWEFVRDQELSSLGQSHEDGIMPVLKLSYDHLPSNLKHCFASLSFFPKDFRLKKLNLMYLWISQGYIKSDNQTKTSLEDTSHLYFMYLLRRGLFQEVEEHDGEIVSCKIHDLIHDLAQHVAGEESIVLKTSSDKSICARHVSIVDSAYDSRAIPIQLLSVEGIRSFTFVNGGSISEGTLDQLFANFKSLRTLSLRRLQIKKVPDGIGELKHLRYLDISENDFEGLPDSMANLTNLLTLVVEFCRGILALPDNFRKLMNLRYLNINGCNRLKHMPSGFEELTCLQYLSSFKVGRETEVVKRSGLDVLPRWHLRGELLIEFDEDMDDWDEGWQLPVSPNIVGIHKYPGMRIPEWDNGSVNNLTYLTLYDAAKLQYLPPLRYLPNLKKLLLKKLNELEYVEMEEESCRAVTQGAASTYFPRLEILRLSELPKLKGWRRTSEGEELFLPISQVYIIGCENLKSIPPCPFLHKLELYFMDGVVLQHMLSIGSNPPPPSYLEEISFSHCEGMMNFSGETLTSLRRIKIDECRDLKRLLLTSPHLEDISVTFCDGLLSIQHQPPTNLSFLKLKEFNLKCLMSLEELVVHHCPEDSLWKLDWDWEYFPNLRSLTFDSSLPDGTLPEFLQQLVNLGQLQINDYSYLKSASN